MEAARQLQYVPSASAASLKSGKTGVVGVVVPYLTRWFFAHLIDGAEARLRADGYHILLFNIGVRGPDRARVLDPQLLGRRLDAVLVLSADLEPAEIRTLRDLRAPIVTVGLDLPGCPWVGIDDAAAADTAMTYLLGLGHRRVAYIGGNPRDDIHVATAHRRWAGVQRAAARYGVTLTSGSHVFGNWTVRGGIDAAAGLLGGPELPTAVLAASDEMALGVLFEARRRGICVPGELSVVGIDDHEMSFMHGLTTVRQDVAEQGRAAAGLLLAALTGCGLPEQQEVVLPTELVIRDSTAPPAGSPLNGESLLPVGELAARPT